MVQCRGFDGVGSWTRGQFVWPCAIFNELMGGVFGWGRGRKCIGSRLAWVVSLAEILQNRD